MQRIEGRFVYSASDLNDYVECRRLTELESLVARRVLARPDSDDPQAEILRRKGEEHERRHLERLAARFPEGVTTFGRPESSLAGYQQAEAETLAAMRAGAHVIYQATFFDGEFIGHADFLRRVEIPSDLGNHSYEVVDTKLGLTAKPYYIVQLCNYSEHLERLQGRMPEFGHVVFGDGAQRRFRLHDYLAYYRHLKRRFLEFASEAEREQRPRHYAIECGHCSICPWNDDCEQQRRDDDHLSLVAWMRRDQIGKVETAGIARVSELAAADDERRPPGMSAEMFAKLRRQASLQVAARQRNEPIYELVAHEPPLGFALLPEPAAGDAFFDMEGDPLYEPGRGLEYLFGCWLPGDQREFRAFWGVDRAGEKRAFEEFVDFITDRRRRHPGMHVYHYAAYEKSALRRLAQHHCTREEQVDDLLRGEVLVDLFSVVRQALAISEEHYGLKNLERFYDLARQTEVKKGDQSIVMFERWLLERDQRLLDDIEAYNRDDCRSTHLLRDWLLARRAEAIAAFGIDFPFRAVKAAKEAATDDDAVHRSELERTLLAGVTPPQTDEEYRAMSREDRARYLLGNLLAYHRREERPAWWAYFDRFENVDQLLEFNREAIGGLKLCEDVSVGRIQKSNVYTYQFPEQLHKLAAGDAVENPRTRGRAGTILSIDDIGNRLELKSTAELDVARAICELTPGKPPSSKDQRRALAGIATSFVAGRLAAEHPATHDLLTNGAPRARGLSVLQPEHVSAASLASIVGALDQSYLFVQGPPGTGKSTIAAEVICDLLTSGKRVAVTSTGHKGIHNLLHMVEACMARRGGRFRGRYKHSNSNAGSEFISRLAAPFIESREANDSFYSDDYQLAGGTGWLCAREELVGRFDYLFIDEAGQVALADALAMSLCAKNVVLLGDPSQLAQVSQGRQPLHVGSSVLEHLLGDALTVDPRRGVFLAVSYRMRPEICAFISDAMYEGRLRADESTRNYRVTTPAGELAALTFTGIEHAGNGSSSSEEADEIVRRIILLRAHGFIDGSPVTDRDIIVVTPYNAQRRLIRERLRDANLHVEVGTVDKFQGQQAAIVFYSMATSSGEDVPRNVEFLFDRNRFNVAISRARAASVLVCSPRLLDLACRTPEQMALANLLCSFYERAAVESDREGNRRSLGRVIEL